jgi:GT2 family glycosyltransferase
LAIRTLTGTDKLGLTQLSRCLLSLPLFREIDLKDSMTPELDLSICIVSLDTREFLRDCLCSIRDHVHSVRYEIIVVDNKSTDDTVEMLHNDFPDVRLISNDRNTGFSKPNNQALSISRGRYALLLNPDTIVPPGAIESLIKFADAYPKVGICGPKILNRDGTIQLQCRRSFATPWDLFCYFSQLSRLFPKSPLFARYLVTYEDENKTHQVDAVSGACMLIRRSMIDQIGMLDEQFFAYQEDTDLCFRAHQAGWETYYYPRAQITHFASLGGSRVDPIRSIIEWHSSYWKYYRKNLASRYFFLFNWLYYVIMLAKLATSLVINFLRTEKFAGSRKP